MRKLSILAFTAAMLISQAAHAGDRYVSGYTKSNGTYVQPYHRSTQDSNPYNNYSSQGNTNPYTGSTGYTKPSYGSSYDNSPSTYRNPYSNSYGR